MYGRRLRIEWINLYHLASWLIRPATLKPIHASDHCSMVELLCRCVQRPRWFVSHWWGEIIIDFVAVLERHTALRQLELTSDDVYWVCAYANRQHELSTAVPTDPKESSFYKAMLIAAEVGGVLLVLDDFVDHGDGVTTGPATPFTRIWCAFEETKAPKQQS